MTKEEQLNAEKKELKLLTNDGFKIQIKNLWGKPKVYKAKKMTLGRLFKLSKIFITMYLDENSLNTNDLQEQLALQYQSVLNNLDKVTKVVAICFTDNILISWWIQRQVKKHFTAKDIQYFAQNLIKESDYANFMLSIALMNGNRPTKAKPIED
ncbi:hypothetical protein [Riemerella columbipharyngis]|uniref:Uncharacterized protein n=1 Tax=Riemerella columbipharyngis TaxID=1071918 RepID=A0A1G7AMW5_9FLAO|nr:hypothetical protein [Riemerella columbipharyngis]SDE15355.1 hypothetical protein SAMN05421544_10410 [Riemerella columbipharyngis]